MQPRVYATVQKQEWIGDNAFPVGEPYKVDITDKVNVLGPTALDIKDDQYESDDLVDMGDWTGPFLVRVEEAIHTYFRTARHRVVNDEKLFWSNDQGWVDAQSADEFTDYERNTGSLPMGGKWEDD